jgi:hypothetical protein
MCWYGESGTGKTTEIGLAARWLFHRTGKRTRLVSADLGGWESISDCVAEGIVEPWNIATLDSPIAALRKLSRGCWPEVQAGVSGGQTLRLAEPTPETWAGVGGYACEGLASFGDLIMRVLRQAGPKLGENPSYNFVDGGEKFYGSNMSYYGFVQDTLYELVSSFSRLPVDLLIWTSLDGKGDDEISRQPVYGPAIAGRKAISKVPSWVGDCIHLDSVVRPGAEDPELKIKTMQAGVRAYFQRHPDPVTGTHYPAKLRCPPQALAKVLQVWPRGFLEPRLGKDGAIEDGLDRLLAQMEER